jgi:hypothetical protein
MNTEMRSFVGSILIEKSNKILTSVTFKTQIGVKNNYTKVNSKGIRH